MTATPPSPQIAVVGSVMIDLITYADPLPDAGETVHGSSFGFGFGGKGANQAVTAKRLGADVALIASVGDDIFGALSLEHLVAEGVSTERIHVVPGAATGVAPIWVQADGANRIIIVPGANEALDEADVRRELQGLDAVDAVVCQLEISHEAVAEALHLGRERGALTILNPAPARRDALSLLPAVDWLVPNQHEFELLWGAPPTDAELLAAQRAWGCGLIVTLGEAGAAATRDGEVIRLAPPAVTPIDTTGAGDAFVGSLAVALTEGHGLNRALELANACGALSTEARGTQSSFPTRPQIERRLAHEPA